MITPAFSIPRLNSQLPPWIFWLWKYQVCAIGFYLDLNGICKTQNIPNCATYINNQNVCSICAVGYTLIGQVCVFNPNIPNCAVFDVNGFCIICNLGFYLLNNSCPSQNIPNCDTFVPNVNQCQICKNLYYFVNPTTCLPINDPNNACLKSDGIINQCKICNSSYVLQSGICQLITCSDMYQVVNQSDGTISLFPKGSFDISIPSSTKSTMLFLNAFNIFSPSAYADVNWTRPPATKALTATVSGRGAIITSNNSNGKTYYLGFNGFYLYLVRCLRLRSDTVCGFRWLSVVETIEIRNHRKNFKSKVPD